MGRTTKEMILVDINKLIPYINNARTHSPEQISKLRASLREFGFVNPVIIDKDFNIIAGHGRVIAAKAEGIEEVPCVLVDYLTEAQKTVIASQAMATKRAQEGYTYAQERSFDVAERVAQNEAVGQFTNMGVGLGTMAGVGGAVGGMVGGAVGSAMEAAAQPTPPPQQTTQPTGDMASFKAKVEKLTVMKEAGLISEEEFAQMKAKLLSEIL